MTLIFKPAEGGPAFSGDFSIQVQAPGLLTGGSVQEIVTLYRPDTNNYTWHGIVYPKGTSTDITVNVTYKNVTYKTTLSGCTLTAGSQYEYTLTIQNNILVPVGSEINTTQRSPGIQIAVLLLLLSSCTSGEQETGIGRPLEVTAEIATPVTRATDAHESDYDKRTFVANDQINIYSGASASGSATVYKFAGNGFRNKSYIYRYYPC